MWLGLVASAVGQGAEEDIRGPKPLIAVPEVEPATPWGLYVLGGLLALLVIGVLIWLLKRKTVPEVSAEDLAKRELDKLGREGTELEAGDFALAASQVVRSFIERKFGLAAPKRTTEEFLLELSRKENEALSSRMEPLRGFLKSCDMAKFAGADLSVGDRGELVAKARAFVETPADGPNDGKEAA
ncbi:hypothetical protein ACFQY0_04415 [Haloferula chungangensis]|uniref:DUF4381 domain-containing protein n=2 Tax=Haloferula chungangensis TaxID=1048331 RepID=A0ABW2L5N6_9BACT